MFWQRVCRRRKRFCRLLGLRVHRRDGRIGWDPAWVPEQRLGDVPCAPFCAYLHSPLHRYGHMRRHGILPGVQADEYAGLGYVLHWLLVFIFAALTILATKGGDEEIVHEEHHTSGAGADSAKSPKGKTVKVMRKMSETTIHRHSIHTKAIAMMFVAHPKDKHHPANEGISLSERQKNMAENAKHSKKLSTMKNQHIMVSFGGGLMTSHRVMNADLKIKAHLPKNHKFKSVVHTIIAEHRLSMMLKARKSLRKSRRCGKSKGKGVCANCRWQPAASAVPGR